MRQNPFPKSKIPSYKLIDRKEQPFPAPKNKDYREKQQLNSQVDLNKVSLEELRMRAKEIRKECSQKQQELLNTEKMARIETFKNQNYKSDVVAYQKKSQSVRMALAQRLIEQYKNNNESPLFHNENGLSPFQLLLLHYSRNESPSQNICMICFMDIQLNSHIVELPCSHILHRECAVQNLLYSKTCPGCTQEIVFQPVQNKYLKM